MLRACNRMIVRGHGTKVACAYVRPCPIHDHRQQRLSEEEVAYFRALPSWEQRASGAAGHPRRAEHPSTPAEVPPPSLFDSVESTQ